MDRAQGYNRSDSLDSNRVEFLRSDHHHFIPNVENFSSFNVDHPLNNSAIWAEINKHNYHDHYGHHHQLQLHSTISNPGNVSGQAGYPFTKRKNALPMNQMEEMREFYPRMETYMRSWGAPIMMECPIHHYHHHHYHHPGYYLLPTRGQCGVNPNGFLPAWGYPATPCFPGRTFLHPSSHVPTDLMNPMGHDFGVRTSYGMPLSNSSMSVGIHANPLLRNSSYIFSGENTQYYMNNRLPPQSIPCTTFAQLRISPPEETSELAFPSFYGAENFFDHHSELRLDIDGMSYEELLALGEQIGQVKIGLSREAVLKKLKTRVCTTAADNTGSCIICQAEYMEKERLGTLDCGHEYHADCISEWLLVKNICPVCKAPAVPVDEKER